MEFFFTTMVMTVFVFSRLSAGVLFDQTDRETILGFFNSILKAEKGPSRVRRAAWFRRVTIYNKLPPRRLLSTGWEEESLSAGAVPPPSTSTLQLGPPDTHLLLEIA